MSYEDGSGLCIHKVDILHALHKTRHVPKVHGINLPSQIKRMTLQSDGLTSGLLAQPPLPRPLH
jgi:hypothetical protein